MKMGAPTKITHSVINKLEAAFLMGCSDLEACLSANICKATLYNYQRRNPDFVDRKAILKENPVLKARETVLKGIKEDPTLAFNYLKAKRSDEFAEKKNIGLTDKEGNDVKWEIEIVDAKIKD